MKQIYEYTIDHSQKVIFVTFSGEFTVAELLQKESERVKDPEYNPGYDVVATIVGAKITDFKESHKKFIDIFSKPEVVVNHKRKTAVVTSNPDEVVFSELFRLFVKEANLKMSLKSFSTLAAAIKWLRDDYYFDD